MSTLIRHGPQPSPLDRPVYGNIASMFEYWSDEFSASLRRVIDPPAPVLVDLSVALAPQGPFRRDQVSLRIKRAGLDCTIKVPGLLYAWAQCADNSWIGLVGFAIPTANGRGRIETRQWTVATALSRGGDPSLRG